jgi:CRISPR-associated protein Cas6
MSDLQVLAASMVDVSFPLQGKVLPREHAQALSQALCERMPWLHADPFAGVHPVKLVPGNQAQALISLRTRLLLRVSTQRREEMRALEGCELRLGDQKLVLGQAHFRELLPHSTLYAYRVAARSSDEVAFMAEVDTALADMSVTGMRVCGKHQHMALQSADLHAFSLMLHALVPEQSLRLQQHGIGPHRLLGCGIFVPHKSAAAV